MRLSLLAVSPSWSFFFTFPCWLAWLFCLISFRVAASARVDHSKHTVSPGNLSRPRAISWAVFIPDADSADVPPRKISLIHELGIE